ncbi:uncharacterized protein L969DRAFT_54203 [Mixia osmundae IAM 14324]|uniref:acylaminoacyl-peptidase n=1 Tax=Mixia osmundae (strain CBS 9802 / IAM 14324 / JCM 22182 / KY 12970) TaxID=764103 RepID=G7E268_MIXOS|nr:uncharacterized protein L969DRAFT_54203 [Mixia osmundae IAM 14324]KEI36800.1 hypothetical protein L969DRAFT_54203 [Mixia osmundae IAM 14324]GAA96928.1 hypothetical protein E5Q_03602 [Mixia osmundae IAM 14324]
MVCWLSSLFPLLPLLAKDVMSNDSRLQKAIDTYKALTSVPTVDSAVLHRDAAGTLTVHLELSQRSHLLLKRHKLSQDIVQRQGQIITSRPCPSGEDVAFRSMQYSKDQLYQLFGRKQAAGSKTKTTRTIELRRDSDCLGEVDTTKLHGDMYAPGGVLGTASWHLSDRQVAFVYVAEKPELTFEHETLREASSYAYDPTFGEQHDGKRHPLLFLVTYDLQSRELLCRGIHIDAAQQNRHYGQWIFKSDSASDALELYGTGYDRLPDGRQLGLVFCTNRPAGIYHLTIVASSQSLKPTMLSDPAMSCRSPRYHPQAGLIYLSSRLFGPHNGCCQLWKHGRNQPLIAEYSQAPEAVEPPKFAGVWTEQLPFEPFITLDGKTHIMLTTISRSRKIVVAINTDDGAVRCPFAGGMEMGSWTVVSTDGNQFALCSVSSPTELPRLYLYDGAQTVPLQAARATAQYGFSGLRTTIKPFTDREDCEAIILRPLRNDTNPAIIAPHGGPHGTITTDFFAPFAALVEAGFSIVVVNYPGSLGFGQNSVVDLTKDLGELDVNSVMTVQRELIKSGVIPGSKGTRFLMGGSHAGFINCHISARYASEFDAVVSDNPVTDLPSMFANTDIPEWCIGEVALPYSFTEHPYYLDDDLHKTMRKASPSAHLTRTTKTTPTLLLIGEIDRRVPQDQGRAWYHALKGTGNEVEMLVFPENSHILNHAEADLISFRATTDYFLKRAVFTNAI